MEGDGFRREGVDHRRADERSTERRDDDSSRQVVPARECVRNGRRGVPGISMRRLQQADPGTPEHFTRTGADHCPGGGNQGKGPTVGGQESDSILRHIENVAKHMPVVLGCHCKGRGRCHAEAIKNTLEIRLKI